MCHRSRADRHAGRIAGRLDTLGDPQLEPAAMIETFTFGAEPLAAAVRAIVAAAGSGEPEAAQVAANLVEANLRGHDSHGVGMVPRYVDAVLEGGLAVNA